MNLFIFNFNNRILRSLFAFILIFFSYHILISALKPQVTNFQNQWSENYATAQEYLYCGKEYNSVIVGSSMSNRLIENICDSGIYNLAFAGGSVLSGLKILVMSEKIPEKIFIETNVIEKEIDDEMIDRLFTPVYWNIKRYVPVLQEKYRPVNVFMSFIRHFFPSKVKTNFKQDPVIFEKMLVQNIEKVANNEHRCIGEKELSELSILIQYLQEKGAQIIFFRMPVHPRIANCKSYKEKMESLKQQFGELVWLPNPNDMNYATSDGIHLTYSGALEFSEKFNEWVNLINEDPELIIDRATSNI